MNRAAIVAVLLGIVLAFGMLLSVPNASANWSGTVSFYPATLYVGEYSSVTYTFTSTGTQGSTNIQDLKVSYDWMTSGTWDDLGSHNAIPDGGTATFTDSFVVPNAVGSHSMTISITAQATGDWLSSTSTYSGTISIANRPPLTVSVQVNPSTGTAPVTVTFYSTVSGGTPGYTYAWTFGDGGSDTSANPSHTYTTAGTYTATVVVTDGMSRTQSASATVSVQAASTGGGGGGGNNGGSGTGGLAIDTNLLIGIVVIAAVVLIVAVLAFRRRRPQMPPSQPPMP